MGNCCVEVKRESDGGTCPENLPLGLEIQDSNVHVNKGDNVEKQPKGRQSPDIDRPNMKRESDGGTWPERLPLSLEMQDSNFHEGNTEDTGALVRTDRTCLISPECTLSLRNMLLVGKTGAGKSSTGNTILGRKVFNAATSSNSVTHACRKESGEVAGRQVVLVDTPGLFDTDLSDTELKREISKCFNMTAPGPHAIILVIQLGPFTKEGRLSVEKIRAIFGDGADKYTIIVFTHGDELTSNIDEYVETAHQDLKQILIQCEQRYHVFDNTKIDDRLQVMEFLNKVDSMVACNGGECYTSSVYQDVDKMLREKEKELRQFYEKKLEEQKMELEIKFNKEKQKLENTIKSLKESEEEKEGIIKELQLLDEQKNLYMIEYKRYYDEKLRKIRQEVEQTQYQEMFLKEVIKKLTSLSS